MKNAPKQGKNQTIRTERRRQIAKAVIAQKPVKEIAREVGLTRQMVNLELKADETKQFIRHALAPHLEEIKDLVAPALEAIRDGLDESQEMRDRLRAVKTLGYVMELAEGRRREDELEPPRRFSGTYEDLLILHHTTIHEHHHHDAPPPPTIDIEPET